MDDHWEWCYDNVYSAFEANDFVVRKDQFRDIYVNDVAREIQEEMDKIREENEQKYRRMRRVYTRDLRKARATV